MRGLLDESCFPPRKMAPAPRCGLGAPNPDSPGLEALSPFEKPPRGTAIFEGPAIKDPTVAERLSSPLSGLPTPSDVRLRAPSSMLSILASKELRSLSLLNPIVVLGLAGGGIRSFSRALASVDNDEPPVAMRLCSKLTENVRDTPPTERAY